MLRSNHRRGRCLKNQGCDRTFLGWSWARYTLKTRYDTCSCGHARGSWRPGTRPRGHVGQAGSSEGWREGHGCARMRSATAPVPTTETTGGLPAPGQGRCRSRPGHGLPWGRSHAHLRSAGEFVCCHTQDVQNRGKQSQAAAVSVKEKGRINKRGSRPGKSLGLRDETGDSGPEKRFRFHKVNCGPQPLRQVPPASVGS